MYAATVGNVRCELKRKPGRTMRTAEQTAELTGGVALTDCDCGAGMGPGGDEKNTGGRLAVSYQQNGSLYALKMVALHEMSLRGRLCQYGLFSKYLMPNLI